MWTSLRLKRLKIGCGRKVSEVDDCTVVKKKIAERRSVKRFISLGPYELGLTKMDMLNGPTIWRRS